VSSVLIKNNKGGIKMTTKKDTIEINKSTLMVGVIVVLVIAFAASLMTGGFSGNNDNSARAAVAVPSAPAPTPSVNMKALVDDDAVLGDKNAPVTIVEFSDYECPFCGRFYSQTEGQIKSEYIDTGKVKLIYRDFPLLRLHKNAQKAAEAAECAGEQDKYYEMHDMLFENGVTGGVTTFKGYAKSLGLDTAKFDKCLDSGAMTKEIAKDVADAQAVGVQGTPAFYINGKLISGAQPYSVFKTAIDSALAN